MSEEEESPSELYLAAESGDVERVRLLLRAGGLAAEGCGGTPLHAAAKEGHLQVAELLLDAGHDVDAYSERHLTPLHVAADRDDAAMVELLLRRGAHVDAEDSGDCTALHYVAEHGFQDTARALLAHGAAVNHRCHGLRTPLHFAVGHQRLELTTLLLEAGAHTEIPDRMRQTPLHMAAMAGRVDLARELLAHGAYVDKGDFQHRTPLLIACEYSNCDMTVFLLEAGADVNVVTEDGETVLQFATDARCVEALENHCAKLRAVNLRVSAPHLGNNASADFRGRCEAEVEKLKATKGNGSSASLYDLLASDVHRAAALLRNPALRSLTSQDLTHIFPIYSSMIESVVKKATKKLILTDGAVEALEGLTRGRLPTEILGEVTKYLRDEDLGSVIVAYQGLRLGSPKQ